LKNVINKGAFMKNLMIVSLVLISILSYAEEAWKDYLPEPQIEFSPRQYLCKKIETPILIDGKLDDPMWEKAAWTADFVDIEGNSKPKPNFKTNVKMLWDDNYFYFGCEMEAPHIWAKLKERDAVIFYDNDFEIFIDPQGDTHEYYEFEMNAFNTIWDLLLLAPYRDEGCRAVDAWDIQGLKTAVHIDGTLNNPTDIDQSWSVEVAIPWKVLEECADSCPPKSGEQWRVNFSRVEWDTKIINNDYEKLNSPEHNWVWSPQGIINMHYPEMWGFVQFSENIDDEFIYNTDEDIKFALRKIYYKERTYFMKNGVYTTDLDKLEIENFPWIPQIFVTPNSFEAIINSNGKKFRITHDGRVY